MNTVLKIIHDLLWHNRKEPNEKYPYEKVKQEQEEALKLVYGLEREAQLLRETVKLWDKRLSA